MKNVNLSVFAEVFSLNDCGIDIEHFRQEMKSFFDDLVWDEYDYRQQQFVFLKKHCKAEDCSQKIKAYVKNNHFLKKNIEFEFKNELSNYTYSKFELIKPRRKRAISFYNVEKNSDNVNIKKRSHQLFIQDSSDYYPYSRSFKSLDKKAQNHPILMKLIKHFSEKIFNMNIDINKLAVTIHFVKNIANIDCPGDNSPEGTHQDGMDYIVSALVVERTNINGGVSKLYYPDIKSEVFEIELQPGFGIFQKDKNTDLWHDLTKMYPMEKKYPSYRTSIGIDFKLIH